MDTRFQRFMVGVNDEPEPMFLYQSVSKFSHFVKFPGGIDVQQGKRHCSRPEGFSRDVQHHRRITCQSE